MADGSANSGSDRRKREILDATLRVIAAGGVDAVRHRRVATEADVPLGSITYHFASREELLRSAFLHFIEDRDTRLDALRAEFSELGPDEVVDFIIELTRREFVDTAMVHAEYELLLLAARDPALGAAFRERESILSARVAEALEGVGVGRPFAAARTLVELVRGHEVLRLVGARTDDDLRERLQQVVRAVMM